MSSGLGKAIPPIYEHVLIYFLTAGCNERVAKEFYHTYQYRDWKNRKGKTIKDWKMHAWHWIWM